jgi:hypothetical protein
MTTINTNTNGIEVPVANAEAPAPTNAAETVFFNIAEYRDVPVYLDTDGSPATLDDAKRVIFLDMRAAEVQTEIKAVQSKLAKISDSAFEILNADGGAASVIDAAVPYAADRLSLAKIANGCKKWTVSVPSMGMTTSPHAYFAGRKANAALRSVLVNDAACSSYAR